MPAVGQSVDQSLHYFVTKCHYYNNDIMIQMHVWVVLTIRED
jgi:hypothetical protein